MKSLLGTLSPLYGAISGEGAMGKLLNPAEAKRIADEENARVMAAKASAEQAESNKQAAAGASQRFEYGPSKRSAFITLQNE